MTTRKFVENGLVNSEGSKLLAFIDTVEARNHRWSIATNRDGSYKLDVLLSDGTVVCSVANTIGEAITTIANAIIEAAMEGAPSA
jgi:hypothetical protein